jgi:hypothetical protein
MVAYTYPDCLPFYECSDSPCLNTGTECDPSTVWCDMADQMEIVLNSFDSTVNRTGVGVPLAKVAMNNGQVTTATVPTSQQVIWDTVVMDNDNMVNLDADAQYVKINRPGIWWIELYVTGLPGSNQAGNNGNELTSEVIQRPLTRLAVSTAQWIQGLNAIQPSTVQNRMAYGVQVTSAFLAANSTLDIGAYVTATGNALADSFLTISYAEMTLYWTAESTA